VGGRVTDLVTGATGFIGAALVLELLAEGSRDLLCVVRGRSGASPEERLYDTLRRAAVAYDRADLVGDIERRCHVVAGDLADPTDSLRTVGSRRIDTVWHVAASLNFLPQARDSTVHQNVEGTATALRLAREAGAKHFVHFSTAYVAGTRTGTIPEAPVTDPGATNNPYEESKVRAEMLVSRARDYRVWIVRPGIVIGHSRTFATLSRAGLYDAVVGVAQYKRAGFERLLGERRLHVVRVPSAPVNFIPVDAVVGNAVRIRFSGSDAGIFHLTNASPPTLEYVAREICEVLGVRPPVYVDSRDELTPLERRLADDPRDRFWAPYLSTRRHFDLSNTNAAVGPEASIYPLEDSGLRPYVQWFVDHSPDVSRDVVTA
jgi:nucleoside-diphosphate-sugar epimerase